MMPEDDVVEGFTGRERPVHVDAVEAGSRFRKEGHSASPCSWMLGAEAAV